MILKQNTLKIKYLFLICLILIVTDIYIIFSTKIFSKREDIHIYKEFEVKYEKNHSNYKVNIEKGQIFASKKGKKYYFIHCAGVRKISDKNIIYFTDENSAIKAGYELAKNCK